MRKGGGRGEGRGVAGTELEEQGSVMERGEAGGGEMKQVSASR